MLTRLTSISEMRSSDLLVFWGAAGLVSHPTHKASIISSIGINPDIAIPQYLSKRASVRLHDSNSNAILPIHKKRKFSDEQYFADCH
jgi:hypothetical protein